MRERVCVSVALLTIVLAAGAAKVTALTPVRTIDLTGSWTLQRDLSEPPEAPPRRAGPPDGGPGGGGGFGSGPPGGGPAGGPRGGMGGGRGPGGMGGPARPPTVEEGARMRTAVLEAVEEPSSVGEMEVKARWKDDRHVVETRLKGGLRTTRTLWLDASSGTPALVVLIKVEGGQLPNAVQGAVRLSRGEGVAAPLSLTRNARTSAPPLAAQAGGPSPTRRSPRAFR